MAGEREVTPDGSEVVRHQESLPEPAEPDRRFDEAIDAHVARYVGPVEKVLHELVSPYIHLDVLEIAPTGERPWWTLVTSGTSSRPMAVPPDVDAPRRIELMLSLPPQWQLAQEAFQDERWYWPVRLLKLLGRLPHEYGTWLGSGHTVPNDDPPQPYAAGTELCGAIVLPPVTTPEAFEVLEIPGEDPIHFLAVIPLYAHELDFKLARGTEALVQAWADQGIRVSELLDPQRDGLRRRKRFGLF